jgi:hypothetical protein
MKKVVLWDVKPCGFCKLVVIADAVPCLPIFSTLMIDAIYCSETPNIWFSKLPHGLTFQKTEFFILEVLDP